MSSSFFTPYSKVILPFLVFFVSCSGGDKQKAAETDSIPAAENIVEAASQKNYSYPLQLFKIDPIEFKLNRDDLPFYFDDKFLKEKKIKSVAMTADIKEGGVKIQSVYKWEFDEEGRVTVETKQAGGKTANSIERKYNDGKLDELIILNPGNTFETAIKKVKYGYEGPNLRFVYDILENGDTVKTEHLYADGMLSEKNTFGKSGITGTTLFSYYQNRPIRIEMYKGEGISKKEKGAIYTYTYADGKLLYGDHWYPGISNDNYMFEFDKEGRLREITYTVFITQQGKKVPGKTKSYRYEYNAEGMLDHINYFMQDNNYSQSGKYSFKYQYF